ncbi:hypothetical protein BC830DRAFT_1084257 [Chytriomyces sp. MP71]|nr:hypothetical protein BC830DRAFT_1084257 [Chytriomyces sp. MP71]
MDAFSDDSKEAQILAVVIDMLENLPDDSFHAQRFQELIDNAKELLATMALNRINMAFNFDEAMNPNEDVEFGNALDMLSVAPNVENEAMKHLVIRSVSVIRDQLVLSGFQTQADQMLRILAAVGMDVTDLLPSDLVIPNRHASRRPTIAPTFEPAMQTREDGIPQNPLDVEALQDSQSEDAVHQEFIKINLHESYYVEAVVPSTKDFVYQEMSERRTDFCKPKPSTAPPLHQSSRLKVFRPHMRSYGGACPFNARMVKSKSGEVRDTQNQLLETVIASSCGVDKTKLSSSLFKRATVLNGEASMTSGGRLPFQQATPSTYPNSFSISNNRILFSAPENLNVVAHSKREWKGTIAQTEAAPTVELEEIPEAIVPPASDFMDKLPGEVPELVTLSEFEPLSEVVQDVLPQLITPHAFRKGLEVRNIVIELGIHPETPSYDQHSQLMQPIYENNVPHLQEPIVAFPHARKIKTSHKHKMAIPEQVRILQRRLSAPAEIEMVKRLSTVDRNEDERRHPSHPASHNNQWRSKIQLLRKSDVARAVGHHENGTDLASLPKLANQTSPDDVFKFKSVSPVNSNVAYRSIDNQISARQNSIDRVTCLPFKAHSEASREMAAHAFLSNPDSNIHENKSVVNENKTTSVLEIAALIQSATTESFAKINSSINLEEGYYADFEELQGLDPEMVMCEQERELPQIQESISEIVKEEEHVVTLLQEGPFVARGIGSAVSTMGSYDVHICMPQIGTITDAESHNGLVAEDDSGQILSIIKMETQNEPSNLTMQAPESPKLCPQKELNREVSFYILPEVHSSTPMFPVTTVRSSTKKDSYPVNVIDVGDNNDEYERFSLETEARGNNSDNFEAKFSSRRRDLSWLSFDFLNKPIPRPEIPSRPPKMSVKSDGSTLKDGFWDDSSAPETSTLPSMSNASGQSSVLLDLVNEGTLSTKREPKKPSTRKNRDEKVKRSRCDEIYNGGGHNQRGSVKFEKCCEAQLSSRVYPTLALEGISVNMHFLPTLLNDHGKIIAHQLRMPVIHQPPKKSKVVISHGHVQAQKDVWWESVNMRAKKKESERA